MYFHLQKAAQVPAEGMGGGAVHVCFLCVCVGGGSVSKVPQGRLLVLPFRRNSCVPADAQLTLLSLFGGTWGWLMLSCLPQSHQFPIQTSKEGISGTPSLPLPCATREQKQWVVEVWLGWECVKKQVGLSR